MNDGPTVPFWDSATKNNPITIVFCACAAPELGCIRRHLRCPYLPSLLFQLQHYIRHKLSLNACMRVSSPVQLVMALPNLTYTLHKSLYISLTSRSNTLTLPATRGPQFLLPSHVVAALCRFRDVEHDTVQWKHWCMYLDSQDTPQVLPVPLEQVACLPPPLIGDDDQRPPIVSRILQEVQHELTTSPSFYESIVFAGEGEPTLRFPWLIQMAREMTAYGLPLRLVTNGLLVLPNNNDCDNVNYNPDAVLQHCVHAAEQLKENGVSSVSVALMTAIPEQYQDLMQPMLVSSPIKDNAGDAPTMTAHGRVCRFIESAVKVGLDVETTGVDRPEVNKLQAEDLATKLGVRNPFRWRPYFP